MSDQVVIKVVQNPIRIQMEEPDPIDVHIVEGRDGKSLHPAGAWSSAATYAYLDIVTKDGSSYVALKAVPAGTAVTNTTYWQLLAEAGADGASDWEDITNKPETFPPADHTHGNITAAGAITSSATIANNDSLIIRDNSASSELTSSSITFDGSTTTKALTPKGTWESFASQTDFDTLSDDVDDIAADATDIKSAINNLSNDKADAITESASGSLVTITDGADGLPVKALTVSIEPVQDTSSGDPSPTNVCPITGWTGMHIYRQAVYDASGDPTLSIDWETEAGTVYGGTLDVTNGVLTVTHAKCTMDGVTTNHQVTAKGASDTNNNYYFNLAEADTLGKASTGWYSPAQLIAGGIMCSVLRVGVYYDGNLPNFGAYKGSGGYFQPRFTFPLDDEIQSVANCNAWFADMLAAGTPVEFIYKLATPLTYQLTPAQLTTLLGTNHIWTDCVDVSVTYRADTELFIEAQQAEAETHSDEQDTATREMLTESIESAMTATKNYTAGALIIANGQLLRATSAIANGGTITIGSNAEEVDLETLIAEKAEQVYVAKLPFISSATLYNNIADFHNAIPRGKDITSYFTDGSLWNRINGAGGYSLFEDLYVGDYMTVGGQSYMIVDFDYYIRCSDGWDITDHHIVMMPTENMSIPEGTVLYGSEDTLELINTANATEYAGETVTVSSQETAVYKKWNATMAAPNTSTTAGGYKYSRMRQIIMKAADTIVVNAFGSAHIKPIPVLYPNPANAEASGLASNWTWFKDTDWASDLRRSICDLPNETQIYGQQVWGLGNAYKQVGYEIGADKWQFALFKSNRARANIRANWWLRSVSSSTAAAFVSYYGYAYYDSSTYANGVRPRFLLFG